jgi:hypothetical protein
MKETVLLFKKESGIDLMQDYKYEKNLSFKQRALNNQVRHNQLKIKAFIENVELLAKGVGA